MADKLRVLICVFQLALSYILAYSAQWLMLFMLPMPWNCHPDTLVFIRSASGTFSPKFCTGIELSFLCHILV
jgi:hypothetical protein